MSEQESLDRIWGALAELETSIKKFYFTLSGDQKSQDSRDAKDAKDARETTYTTKLSTSYNIIRQEQPFIPEAAYKYAFAILDGWEKRLKAYNSEDDEYFRQSVFNFFKFIPSNFFSQIKLTKRHEPDKSKLLEWYQQELDTFQSDFVEGNTIFSNSESNVFGTPSTEEQFQCDVFVIMPFEDEFKPIYENHIKRVVERLELKILRGDESQSTEIVMHKIWSQMHNARLVIADYSKLNVNVFYELGMAHTLSKPYIIITQDKDKPFDIRHLDIFQYEYTTTGTVKLEEYLKSAIEKLLL